MFPERLTESIQLDRKEHLGTTGSSAHCNLPSAQNASVEHHSRKAADQQRSKKEVFTFSSKPRSAPYGKSPNTSPESYVFPLELELDSSGEHEQSRTEDSFEGTDSSEEVGHFVHVTLDKAVLILKLLGWDSVFKPDREDKSSFPHTPTGRFVSVRLLCLTRYRTQYRRTLCNKLTKET